MLMGESWAHKGSPGKTNGSHRGCLETPLGSLGAAWGGSGTSWEAPRDNFGVKIDPKLDDFAASVFESVLLKFFRDFLCLFVFTDLKDIL